MGVEYLEPINYCGASAGHIIASRFVFKEGEPLKLFGKEDPDNSIRWLDLSDSKGIVDSTTFSLLPALRYLYIKNCKFQTWSSGVFSALHIFTSLNITKSELSLTEDTFKDANTLGSISLSDFDDIGHNLFNTNHNLKQLSFENCKFGTISKETFAGLENVTYLKLSECKISDILVDAFESLKSLEILVFTDNTVGNIYYDSFLKLTKLTEVIFHNNKIECPVDYEVFKKLPKLETILFDTDLYKDLDFDAFLALKKVNLSEEPNDLTDSIIKKIVSKNIQYGLVFCGKVEVDMSKVQICG